MSNIDYFDGKYYTKEGVKLIKRQLGFPNMPTWVVWGYMEEQGIESHKVLEQAIANQSQEEN